MVNLQNWKPKKLRDKVLQIRYMLTPMNLKLGILIFTFSLLSPNLVVGQGSSSQSPNRISSVDLKKLVAKYDSLLNKQSLTKKVDELLKSEWTLADIDLLFSVQDTIKEGRAAIREIALQQEALKNDWGIGLNMGVLNNFEQSLLDSEGRFFRRRYSSGLRWDVLGGGYLDHQIQAKAMNYRIQQIELEQKRREQEKSARVVYQQILYAFNKAKIRANEAFLQIVNEQIRLLKEQSGLGYDVRESLRDATRRALRISLQLEDYRAFEETLDVIPTHVDQKLMDQSLPLLEMDMQQYKEGRASNSLIEPLSQLEAQRNQVLNSFWRQLSFDLNTQYNYYDRVDDTGNNPFINDREFFSITATVRAPLSMFWGNKNKDLAKASVQRFRQQLELMERADNNEVIGQFREFENRKRRILELKAELEVNSQRIDDQLNQMKVAPRFFQPVVLFNLLNDRYLLMSERIFALEDSYLTFFRIWIQAPHLTPSDYASIKSPSSVLAERGLSEKAEPVLLHGFYIWSESFDKGDIDQIRKLILDSDVERIALSVGSFSDNSRLNKAIDWVEKMHANKVDVDLLISNNNLIEENPQTSITDYINRALAIGADGIHLDVEPHTLDDFQKKREMYLERFKNFVTLSSTLSKEVGLSLSISIPNSYDEILPELDGLATRIYIMNYNRPKVDRFLASVAQELQIFSKSEVIWSLRVNDFTNIQQMNSFIKELKMKSKVQSFMLHDFSDYMKMLDE